MIKNRKKLLLEGVLFVYKTINRSYRNKCKNAQVSARDASRQPPEKKHLLCDERFVGVTNGSRPITTSRDLFKVILARV